MMPKKITKVGKMATNISKNIATAKLLGRALSNESFRNELVENGYTDESVIVVASYDEKIESVFSRIDESHDPAFIVISKNSEICPMVVIPSIKKDTNSYIVSPDSTIGMLYEASGDSHDNIFEIKKWHQNGHVEPLSIKDLAVA